MFLLLRTPRTLVMMLFTISKSAIVAASPSSGLPIVEGLTVMLSPSLRSAMCCHSSSVINGMKGWSRCSRWSKKPITAS